MIGSLFAKFLKNLKNLKQKYYQHLFCSAICEKKHKYCGEQNYYIILHAVRLGTPKLLLHWQSIKKVGGNVTPRNTALNIIRFRERVMETSKIVCTTYILTTESRVGILYC